MIHSRLPRSWAALTTRVLVAPWGAMLGSTSAGQAAPVADRKPAPYSARIERTTHGIPHITGDSFGDIGYGSGYATSETSPCVLIGTLITGRGERSRWFGPLRNRKVVEKLLADRKSGPSMQARAMVRGYAAGSNAYLDDAGRNGITDPACAGAPYLRERASALDVWYGVYPANPLASSGVFVKEIVDADPPSPDDPGIPNPTAASVDRDELLKGLGRDPESPFGSNATAIGGKNTTTGKGMLLGNPHLPWRGRYRFSQTHLTIPGKYDVAGASLIGSPVVNIGFNKCVAWSHTVSTAYRFTPYEYRLPSPATPTTYSPRTARPSSSSVR